MHIVSGILRPWDQPFGGTSKCESFARPFFVEILQADLV